MLLALSHQIGEIDRYAENDLGISLIELMHRSGESVERAVRERLKPGSKVVFLAGKGNNGGDGYAAAWLLCRDYNVTVIDVFAKGQRTECGNYYLNKYRETGSPLVNYISDGSQDDIISSADCIVDAIFGTGFVGNPPEQIKRLSRVVNETIGAIKIAIDVPIGINADTGAVDTNLACRMNATVVLSFIKPGLVSYPAKPYVGEILFESLGLPREKIEAKFSFNHVYVDEEFARSMLPKREENSNKSTFGRLLMITGSDLFPGAAHLSLEGALRGGVGYVQFVGGKSLVDSLCQKMPEALYKTIDSIENIDDENIEMLKTLSAKASATLIGSGCDCSDGLLRLTRALLSMQDGPIIIDADAINVLSENREESLKLIRESERVVILTPHPLEFARLCGNNVADIQLHRIDAAKKFAAEQKCILVLKGAGTIVTDGKSVYINSSGSSALAKAGSGDVLSGFLSAMVAQGIEPIRAASIAVFFHAFAADTLAKTYSAFGVIPSDLPRQIAASLNG